jgi:pimeloyl-ACP methyl ester carboxylesterase
MATFVLVHGGWGGGWEWRPVADVLQEAGHTAYRPTLTGLGERRHLASPQVDLDTHIQDVLAVLETEALTDVVLVGQSYGGAVVTGVADRAPDRIGRLVYVDAFVPDNGQSVNELSGTKFSQYTHDLAAEGGDGWQVPVWFSAEDQGLPNHVSEWYMAHVGPHPLAALDQPIRLSGAVETVPASYIDCEPPDAPAWVFRVFADEARSKGWDYHRLPVGHDAQVIAPDALALLLTEIAAG